jgi:hypothetical protein
MRIPKTHSIRTSRIKTRLAVALAFTLCLTLPACSINVKKDGSGEDKKVDIETPIGGIHVDKGSDVHDTGLAVYPGARVKQDDSSHDDNNANVNISFLKYGVRVVAVEYQSDDAPDKIIAYYKDQLKKYGSVLECHTTGHSINVGMKSDSKNLTGQDLTCGSQEGKTVELKVGSEENQHVVSVVPQSKGSTFTLVYVRTNTGATI